MSLYASLGFGAMRPRREGPEFDIQRIVLNPQTNEKKGGKYRHK